MCAPEENSIVHFLKPPIISSLNVFILNRHKWLLIFITVCCLLSQRYFDMYSDVAMEEFVEAEVFSIAKIYFSRKGS